MSASPWKSTPSSRADPTIPQPDRRGQLRHMSRGHTLVELTAVLALMVLAASAMAPAARRYRDRSAVVGAREAVAGLIAEARLVAMSSGGASVHLASEPWRAWSEASDSVLRVVALETELGVVVELSRGRTRTELHYDALGLGRVASESLGFRRGGAEAGLIVSSYGRVRRR